MLEAVLQETFGAILGVLRQQVGEPAFERWFGEITLMSFRRGVVTLGVPNIFFRDWIVENYQGAIMTAAREVLGTPVVISVNVNPALYRQHRKRVDADLSARDTPPRVAAISLDRFVTVPENEFAAGAVRHLIDGRTPRFNPLILIGPAGCGKSHLLGGVAKHLRTEGGRRVLEVSAQKFSARFTMALKSRTLASFREAFATCDVLCLDEAHRLKGKRATQHEFLNMLTQLVQRDVQIVMAMRYGPNDTRDLLPTLQSTLSRCMSAVIRPYGTPSLVKIHQSESSGGARAFSQAVVETMASSAAGDVGLLHDRLRKVHAYADFLGEAPTDEFVRANLAEILRSQGQGQDVAGGLIDSVCAHFKVRRPDLESKRKLRSLSAPRGLAVCLLRDALHLTFARIGRILGGRTHTSIYLIYKGHCEALHGQGANADVYRRLLRGVDSVA
jgi:chromosomal replication initiator protein